MKMLRKLNKNLLIICEGSATEPNYFDGLHDLIKSKTKDYFVKIVPKPQSVIDEEEEEQKAIGLLTNKRRKRNIIGGDPDPVVPQAFKAQPVSYVWRAQQGLVDQTYDEVWAVFDLDMHPRHEDAFNLAAQLVEGKIVNIGFSSISFETWILLHHELNTSSFLKSQCRTGDESHNCGQGTHEKDCFGVHCTTGYLKTAGYFPINDDIKHVKYTDYEPLTFDALQNAVLLRKYAGVTYPNLTLRQLNPITTVDKLVFKPQNIPLNYIWVELKGLPFAHLSLSVSRNKDTLSLRAINDTDDTALILPDTYHLVNAKGETMAIQERKVLYPGQTFNLDVDLGLYTQFNPIYLSYTIEDDNFFITEIP